jgi:hypothetical protein
MYCPKKQGIDYHTWRNKPFLTGHNSQCMACYCQGWLRTGTRGPSGLEPFLNPEPESGQTNRYSYTEVLPHPHSVP